MESTGGIDGPWVEIPDVNLCKLEKLLPQETLMRSFLLRLGVVLALILGLALAPVPVWAQWGTTDLPRLNQPAPSFTLPDNQGQLRSLDEFQGQWVVLYFYPKDFTSGCTIEARRFQQNLRQFQQLNAQILGISADSVESHKRFCDSEGLKFPLLSDTKGVISEIYGSWMGDQALRNTFIIDPDGILVEAYPIVSPARHGAQVLARLQELQDLRA